MRHPDDWLCKIFNFKMSILGIYLVNKVAEKSENFIMEESYDSNDGYT